MKCGARERTTRLRGPAFWARFRSRRVVLAMRDPAALERAVGALKAVRGVRVAVAPTSALLAAALSEGPALVARGVAQGARALVYSGAVPNPQPGKVVVLGLDGQAVIEERAALQSFVAGLRTAFRFVVADVHLETAVTLGLAYRALVALCDPRPETLAVAERLGDMPHVVPVFVAPWREPRPAVCMGRLEPPPKPERWGLALARLVLRTQEGVQC